MLHEAFSHEQSSLQYLLVYQLLSCQGVLNDLFELYPITLPLLFLFVSFQLFSLLIYLIQLS